MRPTQKVFVITIVLLLGATVYGLIRTTEPPKIPPSAGKGKQAPAAQEEAKATGSRKEALSDQLDLAKAQLELDQDELDDAKQDLIRAGGDLEDRLKEMEKEHEAVTHGSGSALPNVATLPEEFGLLHIFQQWLGLHQKQLQLWRAKQEAEF